MTRSDKKRRPPSFRAPTPSFRHRRSPAPSVSKAIVVYAKAPIEGYVKTRLCPPLTGDEAASLHGSLVMDLLECCQVVKGCDRILAGAPTGQHPFFKAMETRFQVKLWEQSGEDLGARMAKTFQDGLRSAYQALVIVGTDIPGISPQLLTQAVSVLQNHDVVLGPTLDGGYYLIGLRKPVPELFQHIPWSTSQVCALTEQKVKALGLSLARLPTLRDIDTIEDVQAFIQELKRPGSTPISQRTKNVFMELEKRLKARA